MEKKNTVATSRTEIDKANQRGQLPRDLIGGTVAMQEAGQRYIPKGATDTDAVWKDRVNAAVLLNMFKRTVGYLAGQVFSRDVALSAGEDKDVPESFARMAEDIDLQGNNLSRWARHFFEECLSYGAGLVLVDYPMIETRSNGAGIEFRDGNGKWEPKTAQADKKNGWRPYFVYIPQADLLGWRFESVNGKRVMTQLRFFEHVVERQGAWDTDDEPVDQVRVLRPGMWETWRKEKDKTGKEEWLLRATGSTSLDVIPVVPLLIGERCGELCAFPTLEDLAHLNRRHWQATADQYDLMSWMRRPVWHGVALGGETDAEGNPKEMAWGPGSLVNSTSSEARLESVSVAPESIAKGQEELNKLEEQMSMYGMRLLMPRTGNATATQNALESAENDSTLKAWAKALEDCLDQALTFVGMWTGETDNIPTTAVNTEFHILDGMTMAEIKEAVAVGIVSKRMAFDELKRRGLIRDDSDWVEALAEIEHESRQSQGPDLGAGLASSLLGGGS